ncbi:MAG TPA: SDR family NAD(P)-dependent oxidoreductase [Actinomycetota bacterium]|jgi:NAD(P)-dependent dehydrogenase (short-subunit alcohol dehydrogenase family)|nr:SDR family NAD(P)-dependent oxidoreductase [Actinomycetota bacterium]
MQPQDLVDEVAEALVVPSFTRVGHAMRRRLYDWVPLQELSMRGRVVMVTGPTSGLGEVTATTLARMGARVGLIARDADKAEATRERVAATTGNDDLVVYVADMSDLASVRRATSEIAENEAAVDVVINNAGSLLTSRRTSVDGYEMSFATMVLGPFVLTGGLMPVLERSDDARVITVTSGGMYLQGLDLDDLQMEREPYRGTVAYARAKRAQVVLTRLWAARQRGTSVVAHAMHPGWADTPGIEGSLPGFRRLMGPLLRTPEQGADTIAWLAAAPEVAETTGKLWLDRRPRAFDRLPSTRVTTEEAMRLWDACVELTESTTA